MVNLLDIISRSDIISRIGLINELVLEARNLSASTFSFSIRSEKVTGEGKKFRATDSGRSQAASLVFAGKTDVTFDGFAEKR